MSRVDIVLRGRAAAATVGLKSELSRDPAKEQRSENRTRCIKKKSRERDAKPLADGCKTGITDWGL